MTDTPTSCPPIETLDAIVSGDHVADSVRTHVQSCVRCRDQLAAIRTNNELFSRVALLDESGSDPSAEPLASWTAPDGYVIIEELHRGAQGVVFRAKQRATRRIVALKIMHAGRFATSRQRRRFEREVDLLAQLRHPNIVTVFDSGRTPEGGWYIAMEFVEGEPIDRSVRSSCDTSTRRGVADVVRMFTKVCDGAAFLHHNGVIHRDLKPANILVDADAQPRIVDFGLAKAEDADTFDATVTREGEFAGTLAYAAPEQTSGDPSQVDVRSDVYALGVVMYELLTHRPPYSTDGSLADFLRQINEVAPKPPSSRGGRGVDADLDRVLLKALAKDKDDRYESAAALRRDLERWLDGLPVEARPASAWYVLRKTVRRHKAPFVLGTAAVAMLAVFVVSMSVAYRRASVEAAKANQIRIFLEDTLASVNPESPGAEVTVRETLDEAVHWVELALRDQPEVAASLRLTIGNSYRALGRYADAEDQIRLAIDLRRNLFGDNHIEVVRATTTLALVFRDQGYAVRAELMLEEALLTLEGELGKDNVKLTNVIMNLASVQDSQSKFNSAGSTYARALAIRERALGPNHPDTAMCLFRLAETEKMLGKTDLARAHHERALAIRLTGRNTMILVGKSTRCGMLCDEVTHVVGLARLWIVARRGVAHAPRLGTAVGPFSRTAALPELLVRGRRSRARRAVPRVREVAQIDAEAPPNASALAMGRCVARADGRVRSRRSLADTSGRHMGTPRPDNGAHPGDAENRGLLGTAGRRDHGRRLRRCQW